MKRIFYADQNGEKVDLGTMEGIETILYDIFSAAEKKDSCMIIKENVKSAAEKRCKNRLKELE